MFFLSFFDIFQIEYNVRVARPKHLIYGLKGSIVKLKSPVTAQQELMIKLFKAKLFLIFYEMSNVKN